jgi:hypothetical protein
MEAAINWKYSWTVGTQGYIRKGANALYREKTKRKVLDSDEGKNSRRSPNNVVIDVKLNKSFLIVVLDRRLGSIMMIIVGKMTLNNQLMRMGTMRKHWVLLKRTSVKEYST